eukprot:CAMPEP_0183713676 /NCGR_PEP_ID=MMETSP0737-20130205/8452_1 /TAXON_ID=385413 /ORGANISM="Thalassiosira miniscula, Strain CCMP1093" /LENGTH=349 /DNA_ID=CAMNT_0025942495 /DNA_START=12 /DNA_END=1057 /DNA_ORIENTATION=-
MSTQSEDITIFEAFFDDPKYHLNGRDYFYMEIGAHDGVRESNSRFFDVCLGWQGLLVEPHPVNYNRMEKLRPRAHHLGVAPSCMSSNLVMFPKHQYTNAVANDTRGILEIHCGPLSHYLAELGIVHIDFWSLDVEGSELSTLKTVDFNKVEIDVIMAESENRLAGKQEMKLEVRSFLRDKGYLLMQSVRVMKSDIFLHERACHRYSFVECTSLNTQTTSNTTNAIDTEKDTTIGMSRVVTCDDVEHCPGFFQYSEPNHSPNATQILHETAKTYNYGPEKNDDGSLIFFPNQTGSIECVPEWKVAQGKWRLRGMSTQSEDITIFEAFFDDPKYQLNGRDYFYMEIGAHDG